jgi:hypothetical protein
MNLTNIDHFIIIAALILLNVILINRHHFYL